MYYRNFFCQQKYKICIYVINNSMYIGAQFFSIFVYVSEKYSYFKLPAPVDRDKLKT